VLESDTQEAGRTTPPFARKPKAGPVYLPAARFAGGGERECKAAVDFIIPQLAALPIAATATATATSTSTAAALAFSILMQKEKVPSAKRPRPRTEDRSLPADGCW
jgi:hypothetical protein